MAKAKAKAKDKKEDKAEDNGPKPKRFQLLKGLLIGGLIGFACGWIFRPPESFPIDDLREATENKLVKAKDSSKDKVADWAESLAKKLREND
jgi:gas vesicle protein